jgi:predicted molibdopterin-dependent oxidoreductase YjgC
MTPTLSATYSDTVRRIVADLKGWPGPNANVVTTENSDWATNCPEYKVTAVEVVFVNRKDAWQKRAQEERHMPKQQRRRKRDTAPA